MKMVRKQLYITREQDEKLKRLALASGVTEAQILRRAIDGLAESPAPDPAAWQALVQQMRERAVAASGEGQLSDLPWSRADLYQGYARPLDDAAWEEELAFIKQHLAASPHDGQKRPWRREDSYDKRRSRLPD